jgi:ethanolamine ammonia-lyase small subunit
MTATPVGRDPEQALWDRLRAHTRSRIGLGRAGDALDTTAVLDLSAAHAEARDAVHSAVDVDAVVAGLREHVADVPVVASQAPDRSTYLRRPDLGRMPADLSGVSNSSPDVAIVVCDGLSARAVTDHAVPMVAALLDTLPPGTTTEVVVATQARVALGDHIAAALGADALVVLIGERPGLSVADSLGAYLSYRPRPGMADSERNCVSNIHPHGLSYQRAAAIVVALLTGAKALGRSGVDLKDTSVEELISAEAAAELH